MKKIFTILFAVLLSSYSFAQMDTIAGWTFPTGDMIDSIADIANEYNTTSSIGTMGGTSEISFKNGETTKAAQVTNWDLGENTKAWIVEINTTDHGNLTLSSMQTAGGSDPGPRDFILEYRIGTEGEWVTLEGSEITVANDWTTGVLGGFQLPENCNNQSKLFLRWIMTSSLDINGEALLETGKGKIDNILIAGELIDDIDEIQTSLNINLYPNPCTTNFTIETDEEIESIEIFNIAGSKCKEVKVDLQQQQINIEDLQPGIYSIIMYSKTGLIGSKLLMIK